MSERALPATPRGSGSAAPGAPQGGSATRPSSSAKGNKAWRWLRRGVAVLCLIMVPVLLFLLIRNLDWQEVGHALRSYQASTLLLGVAIMCASYLVFASFDLLSRRYTGHQVPASKVLPLAAVCYAFNLNLSSWVGGIALRYRLYGKLGLDTATITKILSLGLVTNWLGYLFIGGAVFVSGYPALPDSVKIGATGLRLVGAAMLLVAVTYVLACRFAKKRLWTVRGSEITLPSCRFALLQAGTGALNWALMGSLIYLLLPAKASFFEVLAILLISSIAGVITHIPAGLGVLETIFISLLQGEYSKGTLLAALIGYRAVYFLLPLAIACVLYLVLERATSKAGGAAEQAQSSKR